MLLLKEFVVRMFLCDTRLGGEMGTVFSLEQPITGFPVNIPEINLFESVGLEDEEASPSCCFY